LEAVRERVSAEQGDMKRVVDILKALGVKRSPEPADFELYTKWRTGQGFSDDVILHVARKNKGKIERVDSALSKYFELKLFEKAEIENFEGEKTALTTLARDINKRIGEYYADVAPIVEEYLVRWRMWGFCDETLRAIASYCFRGGIKRIADMDKSVARFYKMGVTTQSALDEFIAGKVAHDADVRKVLDVLKISREVTSFDRDCYNTWTREWNFPVDMVLHAANLSVGKQRAIAYMNSILSNWHAQKIDTLDKAKKFGAPKTVERKIIKHSYSDKELGRVFAEFNEGDF